MIEMQTWKYAFPFGTDWRWCFACTPKFNISIRMSAQFCALKRFRRIKPDKRRNNKMKLNALDVRLIASLLLEWMHFLLHISLDERTNERTDTNEKCFARFDSLLWSWHTQNALSSFEDRNNFSLFILLWEVPCAFSAFLCELIIIFWYFYAFFSWNSNTFQWEIQRRKNGRKNNSSCSLKSCSSYSN